MYEEVASQNQKIASLKKQLDVDSNVKTDLEGSINEGAVLDKFWRSNEGHIKTMTRLLKCERIYKRQTLEIDSVKDTFKACKARALHQIYLGAKTDVKDWYGSSSS